MRIKKWEAAVLIGFAVALAFAAPLSVQAAVSDKMTRLHVVANSDSAEDQALKLKVRDAVLKASEGYDCLTDDLLCDMQLAAQQCVYQNGYDYPVTVERGEELRKREGLTQRPTSPPQRTWSST
jgi:stage II sporulation protein R